MLNLGYSKLKKMYCEISGIDQCISVLYLSVSEKYSDTNFQESILSWYTFEIISILTGIFWNCIDDTTHKGVNFGRTYVYVL